MLQKLFKLSENKTTVRIEVVAGFTTFMTMAYIIFINPSILAQVLSGGDPVAYDRFFDSVIAATCLSAALATFIMGLWANYPIALAPGMGENFFFVGIVAATAFTWQQALGAVFIAGVVFLIITLLRLRELIINAIPGCLKSGIAVGIGLFIAFIGLKYAGLVVMPEKNVITLGDVHQAPVILAVVGLAITALLMVWRIKGAILLGMLCTTALALISGLASFDYHEIVRIPTVAPTFFKLSFSGWGSIPFHQIITVIAVFFYMDVFDTAGTLIGVGQQAGFLKKGKLPRAGRAFMADSIGTVAGAAFGTSTVTSYIESAAGVEAGGRTGLANMVTGFLFLVAVFFAPVIRMVGGGFLFDNTFFNPIAAPALIIVGSMMVKNVCGIDWNDLTECIPAFLTIIGIPLFFSISHGIAIGVVSYPFLKIFSGRSKDVSWLMYILAVLIIVMYIFVKF